jgi:hypothetical protein
VQCRTLPSGNVGQTITAAPGDKIECLGSTVVRGAYPIIDRVMRVAQIPPGSTAKLSFQAQMRGRLAVDNYGRYSVVLEATDDGGRKGHGIAHVDVMPPSDGRVYLQQTWSGFDASDEASTFPRVVVKLAEDKPVAKGATPRAEAAARHRK